MTGRLEMIAPGARILVRDAEWLIRRVDRTSTGGQALSVVGVSELVRDKEAVFLTEIDTSVEILDPAETKPVQDPSPSYKASMLYIESLLRQSPPTDDNLYLGHRAAMDMVPFQLDPAIEALKQPRQRILIADAVGLGKTLECGILLSELIRRGKGKRILVVAVKSMLTQFQKEMWSRFTIPLTRLDSVGIQRIRTRIPTNHNPFYYYDKSIISIDTLKQDAEYRTYLENAYWDIIVIDEAQNVAERGAAASLRSRLAKLLAGRSDTLIMLSATPHDGRARSFASLMNMLDPTAIANPDDYGPDDIKGLVIRRFKKDIQDQVQTAFKERRIARARCESTKEEEAAFDVLVDMTLNRLNRRDASGKLFKTTLEKSLFSSPAACLQTIAHRIKKLEDPDFAADIASLRELERAVSAIGPFSFSKYRKLLSVIKDPKEGCCWNPADPADRLVIFTERIETLKFLQDNLTRDLRLKEEQVEILHGSMSDTDQQRIVEDFGRDEAPVRLLIASDVASEGINLHFLCHRMIHFDIPWSLMIFQQRNGRIDRYGQERTPEILYLVTESENPKIRGDMRILEVLIEKDEQAVKNIGDPAAVMGVYDIDEEEKKTSEAIEENQSDDEFEKNLDKSTFDPLSILLGAHKKKSPHESSAKTRNLISLFESEFDYATEALDHIRQSLPMQMTPYREARRIELTAPEELRDRFRFLPAEVRPEDGAFVLSEDRDAIQEEIKRSRKDETAWPNIHHLWPLNPVVEWLNDKVLASFGRHEAPVITLGDVLPAGEVIFLMSGLIPNKKSHPVLHDWFGVVFADGGRPVISDFTTVMKRTGLGSQALPNRGEPIDTARLAALLPDAVNVARRHMSERRAEYKKHMDAKLNERLDRLEELRRRQYAELEKRFADARRSEKTAEAARSRERREIDQVFDDYVEWVSETMEIEDAAYIRVVAALKGND